MATDELRARVLRALREQRGALTELCQALGRKDSQNPPEVRGDRQRFAWMRSVVCCVSAEYVTRQMPKINVVARVSGGSPGRRLVLNGHLDTAQLAGGEAWTYPPFGGVEKDGRISQVSASSNT